MTFKEYIKEDQNEYLPSALKWLKSKFGDKYTFKHTPKLNDIDKTYSASIDGKEFTIAGKKYDTDSDGKIDTVAFKIIIDLEKEEEF